MDFRVGDAVQVNISLNKTPEYKFGVVKSYTNQQGHTFCVTESIDSQMHCIYIKIQKFTNGSWYPDHCVINLTR